MREENKRRNASEHVPTCSTWPPPLLNSAPAPAPATPPRVSAVPVLSKPTVSSWELPPDLYERWAERVCIMHYDGRLPWEQAETLALADVLGDADPPAVALDAGPAAEPVKADRLRSDSFWPRRMPGFSSRTPVGRVQEGN